MVTIDELQKLLATLKENDRQDIYKDFINDTNTELRGLNMMARTGASVEKELQIVKQKINEKQSELEPKDEIITSPHETNIRNIVQKGTFTPIETYSKYSILNTYNLDDFST